MKSGLRTSFTVDTLNSIKALYTFKSITAEIGRLNSATTNYYYLKLMLVVRSASAKEDEG